MQKQTSMKPKMDVVRRQNSCATFQLDGCLGHVVVSAQTRQCDGGFLLDALAGGALRWTGGGRLFSQQQQQPLDS